MDPRSQMPSETQPEEPKILRLVFHESDEPLLLSLSSLLYDLQLAHDLATIVSYRDYDSTRLATPYFYYRNGRALRPEHMVRASRITKQSPLTLELVIAAVGGLWVLLQMFDKVSNWSLNRQKLKLEVEKLRRESEIKRLELNEKYEARLQRREAQQIEQQLVTRLQKSEFKLVDLDVRPRDTERHTDEGRR